MGNQEGTELKAKMYNNQEWHGHCYLLDSRGLQIKRIFWTLGVQRRAYGWGLRTVKKKGQDIGFGLDILVNLADISDVIRRGNWNESSREKFSKSSIAVRDNLPFVYN